MVLIYMITEYTLLTDYINETYKPYKIANCEIIHKDGLSYCASFDDDIVINFRWTGYSDLNFIRVLAREIVTAYIKKVYKTTPLNRLLTNTT